VKAKSAPKKKKKRKASLPTKGAIAEYWASQQIEDNPLVEKINRSISWDWQEPSCWACGLTPLTAMRGQTADEIDYREGEKLFTCWNRARFLEKCHIIPESRGGSSDPKNLLLLCKECHREAPDSINPMFMTSFVVNRGSRLAEECSLIKKLIGQHGLTSDIMSEMYKYCEENKEEYDKYIFEHTLIGVNRFGAPGFKKITEGLAAMIDFYYR